MWLGSSDFLCIDRSLEFGIAVPHSFLYSITRLYHVSLLVVELIDMDKVERCTNFKLLHGQVECRSRKGNLYLS